MDKGSALMGGNPSLNYQMVLSIIKRYPNTINPAQT